MWHAYHHTSHSMLSQSKQVIPSNHFCCPRLSILTCILNRYLAKPIKSSRWGDCVYTNPESWAWKRVAPIKKKKKKHVPIAPPVEDPCLTYRVSVRALCDCIPCHYLSLGYYVCSGWMVVITTSSLTLFFSLFGLDLGLLFVSVC